MGAAVGAQGRRIAALLNIVIALTTALVIWCAMSIGASILREVSGSALNALVAVALIAVGLVALVRRTPAPSAPAVLRQQGRFRSVCSMMTRLWRCRGTLRRGNEVSVGQAGVLGVAFSLARTYPADSGHFRTSTCTYGR